VKKTFFADINALRKSLVEVQERRQDNQITMKLASVHVVTCDRQYYAKVSISSKAIVIAPYDVTICDSFSLRAFEGLS
jgi:hypothetical protein